MELNTLFQSYIFIGNLWIRIQDNWCKNLESCKRPLSNYIKKAWMLIIFLQLIMAGNLRLSFQGQKVSSFRINILIQRQLIWYFSCNEINFLEKYNCEILLEHESTDFSAIEESIRKLWFPRKAVSLYDILRP